MMIKDYKLLIELDHKLDHRIRSYGINAFKVRKSKMLNKCKWLMSIIILRLY